MKYSTHAQRILITDKDYSDHKHLIPYDPEVDNGPWIKVGKQHWWGNGKNKITLEFMLKII